jgi:hypothetical protein
MTVDLFQTIVAAKRLHPQFVSLRDSSIHETARTLINALFARMGDPNGSFVRDFQGHGFHGRLTEVAAFAYLEDAGFSIDRAYEYPDFMVERDGQSVAIEVVTANPKDGSDRDVSVAGLTRWTDEEMLQKTMEDFPRRVLATLMKKLRHRYDEEAHVAGRPLVLMMGPFHEAGSSFYVDDLLLPALFPLEPGASPTPFFARPDARSISAVAYCNAFSVSKFWRMADERYITENFIAERSGHAFFEGKEALHGFCYRVGHYLTPAETWWEGLTLIVNPRATTPLPEGLLPASNTITVEDDRLRRHIKGFHPMTSAFIVQKLPDKA